MRSVADAFSVVEHEDIRHIHHGAHPLGNHHQRGVRIVLCDRTAHCGIRFVVQRRRTVVKNQDLRFCGERARNENPLFLTARKIGAADRRLIVETFIQRFNELIRHRALYRSRNFFRIHVPAEADVFPQAVLEDHVILKHGPKLTAQFLPAIGRYRTAVYEDLSAVCVIEAHHQIDDCCLARTSRTDNAEAFTLLQHKADILQGIFSGFSRKVFGIVAAFAIGKGHMVKPHRLLALHIPGRLFRDQFPVLRL